jgi:hypothetical protein
MILFFHRVKVFWFNSIPGFFIFFVELSLFFIFIRCIALAPPTHPFLYFIWFYIYFIIYFFKLQLGF